MNVEDSQWFMWCKITIKNVSATGGKKLTEWNFIKTYYKHEKRSIESHGSFYYTSEHRTKSNQKKKLNWIKWGSGEKRTKWIAFRFSEFGFINFHKYKISIRFLYSFFFLGLVQSPNYYSTLFLMYIIFQYPRHPIRGNTQCCAPQPVGQIQCQFAYLCRTTVFKIEEKKNDYLGYLWISHIPTKYWIQTRSL